MLTRRWEDHQFAVVKLDVRNRNQRLVSAPIVPAQIALLATSGLKHAQNTFNVGGSALFVVHLDITTEEVGRRHLAGVTHNHNLLAAHDGAKCIDGFHL
ncbi:hypothetical protein D3C76_1438030 [compost metagenome]